MTHTTEPAHRRSRALGRGSRATAAVLAGTLGLSALSALPAFAHTGTWLNGGTNGETISVADAVIAGDAIRLKEPAGSTTRTTATPTVPGSPSSSVPRPASNRPC